MRARVQRTHRRVPSVCRILRSAIDGPSDKEAPPLQDGLASARPSKAPFDSLADAWYSTRVVVLAANAFLRVAAENLK